MTIEMKKMKGILLILHFLTLVQLIILLGLGIYLHKLRKERVETEWCSSLILKSDGNSDHLRQLIVKNDKYTDRNLTCGKLSIILDSVVTKRTPERYKSNMNPEYLTFNVTRFGCTVSQRASSTIQLYGIASHAITVPGKQAKVKWHFKRGTEIDIEALEEEGVIYIKQSGYYYVSSLLTLRAKNLTKADKTYPFPDVMSHVVNVIHHNDRTNRVLLENVKSLCELAFEHAEWSSHIGAVFHLNENDKVYVATSHPYNIITGHSYNYLSIHTIM